MSKYLSKRIGWHTLRHTFGTPLKAHGEDVATVQALMRHANVSVTMNTYVQAVTPANAKRNEASSSRLEKWPQIAQIQI
jgi:integrase